MRGSNCAALFSFILKITLSPAGVLRFVFKDQPKAAMSHALCCMGQGGRPILPAESPLVCPGNGGKAKNYRNESVVPRIERFLAAILYGHFIHLLRAVPLRPAGQRRETDVIGLGVRAGGMSTRQLSRSLPFL